MKKLISFILLFSLFQWAEAYEIKSKIRLNQETNEIEKFLEIQCQEGTQFCMKLCNQKSICQLPETICEDCATQSSQTMHTIFTQVNSIFKADPMFVEEAPLLAFFKTKKFMSIPHDLFLNLFTPEKKAELKAEFEKLCYIKVESSILLATIDENNKVQDLVGVICKDNKDSVVLPMTLNPDFSNKNIDFWRNLNTEMGIQVEGLKLKMSTQLN